MNMWMTSKAKGGLGDNIYKRLYPTGTSPWNSVAYVKSTKRTPPRVMVSGRCVVTYGVAKELANILRLLVGDSLHHIRHTQDYVDQVKSIRLGEESASYPMMWNCGSCHLHSQTQAGIGCKITSQNIHVRTSYHYIVGVLHQKCLLSLPS